ncbi:MAG: hypothetical protein VB112_07375 [Oscillospiraceae bacterium]|nr:hypothetical protein [Oscillospiraceae bacterium]
MKDEVLALVTAIAGAKSGDSAWLSPLCVAAVAELEAKLSNGVKADDCHDAFLCAGAYLVWADFIAAGTPGSFTAGDVTVKNDASDMRSRQKTLREMAWRIMRPYIGDEDFAFTEAEG